MNRQHQSGSMYSTLFMVIMVGAAALVGLKVFPVYMNEFKARSACDAVANAPESKVAGVTVSQIRKRLQQRWDVDDIESVKVSDIKFFKTDAGKVMRYQYEVRTPLVANWSLVIEFKHESVLGGGA